MRPVRTRLALLLSALGTFAAAAVVVAMPARAASGTCPLTLAWSGDRVCYYQAGTGYVQWTVTHVFTGPDGHDRAAGEAYGIAGSTVYFDISRDGGRTWTSHHDPGLQTSSFYGLMETSDAAYDGPGYWVRTCATSGRGDSLCTAWH